MERIWNFFLINKKFTYLLIIALLLGGIFSAIVLPKEANPEVQIPMGIVTTVYAGASPEDIERLVTDEIEKQVGILDDVDNYTSTSQEGISSVTVEFSAKADIKDKIRALEEAARKAEPYLPNDAETPLVTEVSFDNYPIFSLSFTADVPEEQLRTVAEDVQDAIEGISGVSDVKLAGLRSREVAVIVDKTQLDQYGVSLTEIVAALQNNNSAFPVGSIETDQVRYSVRFDAEVDDPEDIGGIPVKINEGFPVYLRDVASVDFTLARAESYSRVSTEGQPSAQGVSLMVYKRIGGNIIEIAKESKEVADEIISADYPDTQIVVTVDMADEIRKSLGSLLRNGISTVIIIGFLLFIFLGWREAVLAGFSIPITFMFGFMGMSFLGSSINFLSLFSLILALGIVVDTGIVITEGLHENIKNKGKDPLTAAKDTVSEFQWPLIAGTLTTVSAFFPMLLMGGIMGEFIKHIPITVNLVLLGSLFTALALLPAVGSRFLKKNNGVSKANKIHDQYIQPNIDKMHVWYREKISMFMNSSEKRGVLIISLCVCFILSMALPITGLLKAELFPENDLDYFWIDVQTPVGTVLDQTDSVVRQIEEQLYGDSRIESFLVNVGSGNAYDEGYVGGLTTHLATFTVNLYEKRDYKTPVLVTEYRKKLSAVSGAKITVRQPDSGPPSGAPVLIRYTGPDNEVLKNLSDQAVNVLENIPGTTDVDSSLSDSVMEFVLHLDREKAAQNGLSAFSVAQILRTGVAGTKATTIRYQGDDIDVNVSLMLNSESLNQQDRTVTTIDEIQQMTVGNVSLSSIVETIVRSGNTSVRHRDGDRQVSVSSYLQSGVSLVDVTNAFENNSPQLPTGYSMNIGGEFEDIQESFRDLFKALFLGLFLIASILLLQFNSFKQPLYILTSLPLALIAIFPALTVLGLSLSFPSFIGIVALSGVVVNDAIILVDKINRNRKNNMQLKDAIINAGSSRLQPILLTSITTIAGILPLTLSDPVWAGLGFSIIFGLMFATILTLFVTPTLYLIFEKE